MEPALRAAVDRLWLDGANTLHVASLVTDEMASRVCPATGWTVSETLAHAAAAPAQYAATLDGTPVPAPTPGEDLAALLGRCRARLLAALAAGEPGTPATAANAHRWSLHYAEHAYDYLEALPELRTDPLVINWAFWARFDDDAMIARRAALVRLVQDALAEAEKPKKKRRLRRRGD